MSRVVPCFEMRYVHTVEDRTSTVCPQKIRSLGIDTIFDAIFYEDSIKNKVYNC